MEPMDIFYQILHEDLNPLTSITTQKLLQEYSKTNTNDNLKTSPEKFYLYKALLSDTLKKVKRDIHHKVFQCLKDPISIQSIIQNHQILILNYCRVIEQTYLSEDQNSKFEISEEQTDTDIFKLVYQILDAILDYLEVSFYKYLEHSLEMPYQRKLWFVYQKKERCRLLQSMIRALDIPVSLKDIICEPLQKIIDNNLDDFTYEKKNYYSILIKVLFKLVSKDDIKVQDVYAVLISLEFNTFKIFFYIRDEYLSKKLKRTYNDGKKIIVLQEFLKEIKTTTITSKTKYNPNLPSLKEQLLLWIEEEIISFQKSIENSYPSLVKEKITGYSQKPKRILHLSVSEISLIIRLLYEQGMLEGHKKTFFEFVSKTFKTHKTKTISPVSLSNRYYSVPESTKISVKKKLRGMLLQLDMIQGDS